MSNYKWLLDAGHGGMKNGKYTTAPGKMHVFGDGLTIYEGVNNRAIVNKLVPMLERTKIDYAKVYDEEEDTPLGERVAIANRLHKEDAHCIYLSIHSDAMPDRAYGKGSGYSIYTSKGYTRSDLIADIFCVVYARELMQFKLRKDISDGDDDREENFYVLRKTHCPAILVENLFFDNRREAEFLLSEAGRETIAATLFKSILETERQRPV